MAGSSRSSSAGNANVGNLRAKLATVALALTLAATMTLLAHEPAFAEEAWEDIGSAIEVEAVTGDDFVFGSDELPVLYENYSSDDGSLSTQEGEGSSAQSDDSPTLTTSSTATTSSNGLVTIELDEDVIDYTSSSTVTMQIPNEENNGIYLLSSKYLTFFSLDDYSCTEAYTFPTSITSAYTQGSYLYVLKSLSTVYVYDLDANELETTLTLSTLTDADGVTSSTAIGADSQGRIYIATTGTLDSETVYQLWLFEADGTYLSSTYVDARVYSFDGFESDTGYFFMESYYNWVYWGYNHPGRAATMGIVEDDVISFVDTSSSVVISGILTYYLDCLDYLCQSSYYLHQKGVDVIGDKYLVMTSMTYGRVQVIDIETMTRVLYISRSAIEETQTSTYYDTNSIGVRTVYNEANDTVIVYENEKTLNEYDVETGEIVGTFETAHYVFNLLTMGDDVIAIEKEDGNYYIEILSWVAPTEFEVEAPTTMKVGEMDQATVSSACAYESLYSWSTSDSTVVSVTDSGVISAWSEGTATITYSSPDGQYSASIDITVSDTTVDADSLVSRVVDGTVTDNVSDNNYTVYGSTVDSYLVENDDGTFYRVENMDSYVLLEKYSADYELLSAQTVEMELPIFGGFFSGDDYNYIVFGDYNYDEDDSAEVLRIVKYTKSWTRVSECSISDINTYEPFDAGSLRMTEYDGTLYIHTCHTMYASSDGYNHQANMTFVVDESSMSVTDSYSDILNISQAGYVSHSFNQFVRTDGEYVFRVDHGDAAPRAISITRASVDGSITSVSYTYALTIQGTSGVNSTGVSVGGMELSDDNVLIVGNSVDQSSSSTYSASGQRNIFLTVTDKTYLETTEIWLTDYTSSDGVTPRTPQLVKLKDDQFLIMWEEYYSSTGSTVTRMVTVNGEGTVTSDIAASAVRLSDCQPILCDDGTVTWYVSDGDDVKFYTLNPYYLPENAQIIELYGSNRYETMTEIMESVFSETGSTYAVIATGANFPDALAAASLAGVLDAPIVLVNDKTADDAVAELQSLGVEYAYVIGGTSAVSESVVSAVEEVGIATERVYGSNRTLTAVAIADKVLELTGDDASDTCIVAAGMDFPDALSGSPYSYWSGSPIYLAGKNGELSADTLAAIEAGGYSNVVILGGTSAVSANSAASLKSIDGVTVKRVYGSNRYETSAEMAAWSVSKGMSYDGLAIATGTAFPDALAGASLCGQNGSVILLAHSTAAKSTVLSSVLEECFGELSTVYILGGTGAVSEDVRNMVKLQLWGMY